MLDRICNSRHILISLQVTQKYSLHIPTSPFGRVMLHIQWVSEHRNKHSRCLHRNWDRKTRTSPIHMCFGFSLTQLFADTFQLYATGEIFEGKTFLCLLKIRSRCPRQPRVVVSRRGRHRGPAVTAPSTTFTSGENALRSPALRWREEVWVLECLGVRIRAGKCVSVVESEGLLLTHLLASEGSWAIPGRLCEALLCDTLGT